MTWIVIILVLGSVVLIGAGIGFWIRNRTEFARISIPVSSIESIKQLPIDKKTIGYEYQIVLLTKKIYIIVTDTFEITVEEQISNGVQLIEGTLLKETNPVNIAVGVWLN